MYHSLWLDFSYFFATYQLPLFVKCWIHICCQQSLASIEFSSITRMQRECVCYPTVLSRAYNAFQWDWCVLARSRWVFVMLISYICQLWICIVDQRRPASCRISHVVAWRVDYLTSRYWWWVIQKSLALSRYSCLLRHKLVLQFIPTPILHLFTHTGAWLGRPQTL